MSAISLKSITGITSITTPAGVDNQLTLHTNNTTERVKIDVAGNVHVNNHLNIAGVTTVSDNIEVVDSKHVYWGTDKDLSITHNGTHGYLHAITGGFYMKVGNGEFLSRDGNQVIAKFLEGTGGVKLYNNGTERLATTHNAVSITGNLNVSQSISYASNLNCNGDVNFNGDNSKTIIFDKSDGAFEFSDDAKLRIGDGNHFQIFHDGTDTRFTNNSEQNIIKITSSENVSITNDLDVDGHTNLDNVNIVGVTTTNGNLNVNGVSYLYGSGGAAVVWGNTGYSGHLSFDGSNNAVIRAASGKALIFQTDHVNTRVTIGSQGNVSIAKDLDVDGHTNLDNVSIAGVTTITGSGNALEIVGGLVRCRNTASARFVANNGSAEGYFGWSSGVLTVGQAAATLSLEATGSNYIQLKTNGNETLRIMSDGKLMTQAAGQIYTASSAGSLTLAGGNTNLGGKIVLSGGNSPSTGDIRFYAQMSQSSPAERLRITSDGFIGINDDTPYTGLTINTEGDYWDTNGNTYAHPEGRVLSTWRGDRNDNTDYWVGFVGKYMKPSATVNILLQPHVGNFNNQAGMYIAGEATGNFSSDFTLGKINSGNVAGRGTTASSGKRATKSELLRIKPSGNLSLGNTHAAKKVHISTTGNQKILIDPNYNNNSGGSSNSEANANNIVESILIRTSFGDSAHNTTNAGHKWGIKFQGYNGNDFTQATAKCAGVFAVSEDEAGGYNRNVGLTFHTSPYNTAHREVMRLNTNGIVTKPYQYVFTVSTSGTSKNANWQKITGLTPDASQCTGVSDGTNWSNSTQRFTAPVTGVYHFFVGGWAVSASNGSRYAYTFKHTNGNNYKYIGGGNYCLVDSPMDGFSRTIKLSAGEWVELWGYSSVSTTWGGGHHFFWGGYLLG